jgi:hypothetical protein
MSTPETGAAQFARLIARRLNVALLDELRDVDEIADAIAVAALAPETEFARQVASLAGAIPECVR